MNPKVQSTLTRFIPFAGTLRAQVLAAMRDDLGFLQFRDDAMQHAALAPSVMHVQIVPIAESRGQATLLAGALGRIQYVVETLASASPQRLRRLLSS